MALPGKGSVKSATRIPPLSFPQVSITRKGTHQNNNFLLLVPIADTARTTATLKAVETIASTGNILSGTELE